MLNIVFILVSSVSSSVVLPASSVAAQNEGEYLTNR